MKREVNYFGQQDVFPAVISDVMRAGNGGFTMVEVMIVVAIIGLLAALAIPSISKARHNTQKNTFLNDLRVATDAFETYNINNRGKYPANRSPGILPPEMADYLARFSWTKTTPIGGSWDWDYNTGGGVTAGISVRGGSWGDTDMQEIDDAIDDGNLTTGDFRKIGTDFTWIIE
jgi:prepilin-type N-terminal cleavage/methylation domain-containing protein